MAEMFRLYMGIVVALALCKYSQTEGNVTEKSSNSTVLDCLQHSDRGNCTEPEETEEWNGHFSKCPDELKHYCVHGECRYITQQKTPSCRCMQGYGGARCEYVILYWRIGEKEQIIIFCVIGLLVILMLLIVFLCFSTRRRLCWSRRRRREEPRNGTEKLSMMVTDVAHTISDSTETPRTEAV